MTDRTLVLFAKYFFQLRRIFNNPAVDGGMIYLHTVFQHKLLNITIAQCIGKVPPDMHQYNILFKMLPLETEYAFDSQKKGETLPEQQVFATEPEHSL
jgi:hypothetical protein